MWNNYVTEIRQQQQEQQWCECNTLWSLPTALANEKKEKHEEEEKPDAFQVKFKIKLINLILFQMLQLQHILL